VLDPVQAAFLAEVRDESGSELVIYVQDEIVWTIPQLREGLSWRPFRAIDVEFIDLPAQ